MNANKNGKINNYSCDYRHLEYHAKTYILINPISRPALMGILVIIKEWGVFQDKKK
jgi:hypothetical protein